MNKSLDPQSFSVRSPETTPIYPERLVDKFRPASIRSSVLQVTLPYCIYWATSYTTFCSVQEVVGLALNGGGCCFPLLHVAALLGVLM